MFGSLSKNSFKNFRNSYIESCNIVGIYVCLLHVYIVVGMLHLEIHI